MKNYIYFLFLATLMSFKPSTTAPKTVRNGKDYALFFAVNTYQNAKFSALQNPINDCKKIAEELTKNYGFQTEIVENPPYEVIEQKLNDYNNKFNAGKFDPNGQLLIFFSGHGSKQLSSGYFLPADANPEDLKRSAFNYKIWRDDIDAMGCKHIMVAIDACYSGTFDPKFGTRTDGLFGKRSGELTEGERVLSEHDKHKTRLFFTSGESDQPTPDKSDFAKKFLSALYSDGYDDGILTSSEMFSNHLDKAVPQPRTGEFGGDEAGSSFLFVSEKKQVPLQLIKDSFSYKSLDWQRYYDSISHIEYYQPKGWKNLDTKIEGMYSLGLYQKPKEKESDMIQESTGIYILNLDASLLTLQSLALSTLNDLKKFYPDAKAEKSRMISINGVKAFDIQISGTQTSGSSSAKIYSRTVILPYLGRPFMISQVANFANYRQYEPIFNQILASIKIDENKARQNLNGLFSANKDKKGNTLIKATDYDYTTTKWQSHHHQKSNLSFKFPPNWYFQDATETNKIGRLASPLDNSADQVKENMGLYFSQENFLGSSPQEAAMRLMSSLVSEIKDININNIKTLNINDKRAYEFSFVGTSVGQKLVWVYTVMPYNPNSELYLVSTSAFSEFNRYEKLFYQIMASIRIEENTTNSTPDEKLLKQDKPIVKISQTAYTYSSKEWKKYIIHTHDIHFQAPATWELAIKEKASLMRLFSPVEDSTDTFKENISFMVLNSISLKGEAKTIASAFLEEFQRIFNDVELISYEEHLINGQKAFEIQINSIMNNIEVETILVIMPYDEANEMLVTLTTAPDRYMDYKDAFYQVLASIRKE